MMKKTIEQMLNNQIAAEGASSQLYLSMAIWAETKGLEGTANFFYEHSDEERFHMLKLIKYVNERGGTAELFPLGKPKADFKDIQDLCNILYAHEVQVSSLINDCVGVCLEEKDYTTHNFLQWFVNEQIEEEALAKNLLDKLDLIGKDGSGLYHFDKDIAQFSIDSSSASSPA